MAESNEYLVKTPLFPLYSEVRQLLGLWDGTPKGALLGMLNAIWDQTGTPQNPVDWSNPDDWIDERLSGEARELARHIWVGSDRTVNPRHTYGAYLFINTHGLLVADSGGAYQLTETGRRFKDKDPSVVRRIDELEGLPNLLAILAVHSPAKRGDLLEDWGDFLHERSKFGTASTIKDTLRRRLRNLDERGYVKREGNTYAITDEGIAYSAIDRPEAQEPHQHVLQAIKGYNDIQIRTLRERLSQMDPYKFEALIKDLLEAMDYEDVVVTKQSGDKGVDVIANYQFGITQIKEVVQVKRHQGTLTRPVLDQLRGALPYHQAIRGTIITLGRFAKGCEAAAIFPGAAPITLIDGDKLMELLLKHGVCVKKKPQTLIEIDESYFLEGAPDSAIEAKN